MSEPISCLSLGVVLLKDSSCTGSDNETGNV